MTLQFSKNRKHLKINDKVYPYATLATQCNANCNAKQALQRQLQRLSFGLV